jgi:hypothetical protein
MSPLDGLLYLGFSRKKTLKPPKSNETLREEFKGIVI